MLGAWSTSWSRASVGSMSPTDPAKQPTAPLSSGGNIPLIGLGTWRLHGQECYEAVRHALEVGYRHIDTATMYGNEADIGQAIRDSSVPRENIFLTTKLRPQDAGRERAVIADSLSQLGTDYVDLWLVHWPPNGHARPQTWQEFLGVRHEGLAQAVGVSNYSAAQIDELVDATGVAPSVNQVQWTPSLYDAARVEHHHKLGIVLEGYSPFRAGNLAEPALVDIARAHQVTPARVVLRWHIEHGFVAIPKSARPERIEANFDVFSFSLTNTEVAALDALSS